MSSQLQLDTFVEYLLIHEFKNVMKSIKTNNLKPNMFSIVLNSINNPRLHSQYSNLRELSQKIIENFTDKPYKNSVFHSLTYMKSKRYHSNTKPPLSTSSMIKSNDNNYSAVRTFLGALLSLPTPIQATTPIIHSLKSAAILNPRSNYILAMFSYLMSLWKFLGSFPYHGVLILLI